MAQQRYAPTIYRVIPPLPGALIPFRWQDDPSGILPEAVQSFYNTPGCQPLTPERLEAVRQYAEYYINAPCWPIPPEEAETWADLRERIKHIQKRREMDGWLLDALTITIDPF